MVRTLFGLASLVVVLTLIGLSATGAPTDPGTSDLGISVAPVRDAKGAWVLQFELRYTGEAPIVVDERSLPWKSSRDLILEAFQLNPAKTRLSPPEMAMRDLPRAPVTLNPGDTLLGSVNLSVRLPELATALRESDVIVFWSNQIRSTENPAPPRLNGGVVIPRQNQP
jgi:hypothetical protein